MEISAKVGDSPVDEIVESSKKYPEYQGAREIPWESRKTTF